MLAPLARLIRNQLLQSGLNLVLVTQGWPWMMGMGGGTGKDSVPALPLQALDEGRIWWVPVSAMICRLRYTAALNIKGLLHREESPRGKMCLLRCIVTLFMQLQYAAQWHALSNIFGSEVLDLRNINVGTSPLLFPNPTISQTKTHRAIQGTSCLNTFLMRAHG